MAAPPLQVYSLNMTNDQSKRKRKRAVDEASIPQIAQVDEVSSPATATDDEIVVVMPPNSSSRCRPNAGVLGTKLKPRTKTQLPPNAVHITQSVNSVSHDSENPRMTPIADSLEEMSIHARSSNFNFSHDPPEQASQNSHPDTTDAYLLHPSDVSQASRKRLRRLSASAKEHKLDLASTNDHTTRFYEKPSPPNKLSPSKSTHARSPTTSPPSPTAIKQNPITQHPSPQITPHSSTPPPVTLPSSPPSSATTLSPPFNTPWWSLAEITGHDIDPTSPDDDGTGLNGIGFRPSPAMAHARRFQRSRQLAEWKAREAREARQARFEKRTGRRGGSSDAAWSGDRDALPPLEPRSAESEVRGEPLPKKAVRFSAF